MTEGSQLPAFQFPVLAWAPKAASENWCDCGLRGFATTRDLLTTYFPEDDRREGWTFVDVEGHSWEAVSSRVAGRDGLASRILPRWLHTPKYRLDYEFEPRAPIDFDAVKSRLHLDVAANPRFYAGDRRRRRVEIDAANSLRDLIKTREAQAIERLQPEPMWVQWLLCQGRASRVVFIAAGAAILLGVTAAFNFPTYIPGPLWPVVSLAAIGLSTSIVVRRLHDLGLSGWRLAVWWLISLICASIHQALEAPDVRAAAAVTWQVVTLLAVAFLALWPGVPWDNRYGLVRKS